ncbi:ABC transporter ATP-binding protein [Candidatus Thorarchaeota archaeon]|nr:MAG: ABC transporter ATP-binding protein [Candidatus Thorarchaeota archaeon]
MQLNDTLFNGSRAILFVWKMPKLSVRNVSKSFFNGEQGVTEVLDGISFEIEEGEFVCLLGPSGCGKTTLLKTIAGLLEADEGEITIDGMVVKRGKSDVGYIFQQESLFPWLTVRQNIEFGLKIKGVAKNQIEDRLEHILRLVDLHEYQNNLPHEISGGQARRAEMARSLVTSPEILISDEALSNLDAQTRNHLQDEILRIWENTGSTILFVTHNVDEAVYTADRILVMSNIPAKIIAEFDVNLQRPRERTDSEFIEYRRKILEILKVEQQKAMERIEKGEHQFSVL